MFRDIFKFKIWGDSLGIDLGTTNTLVCVKDKGVVLNMPSILALTRKNGKLIGIGKEAKEMLGKIPHNILVVRPLQDGVIADFDITQ
ncbi:rod shape-determining protein, partial [Candidatus Aerophobetes bacterium]|nr:rod shape-determining protein [Candidatus Aerophobetes bacterium]